MVRSNNETSNDNHGDIEAHEGGRDDEEPLIPSNGNTDGFLNGALIIDQDA